MKYKEYNFITNEKAIELHKHADNCEMCNFARKCNNTLGCCKEGKKILADSCGKLVIDLTNCIK